MPPFVNTNCPLCNKPNRFDLAELKKKGGSLMKDATRRESEIAEIFEETCKHCGRIFKFSEKGGDHGKKK